MPHGTAGPPASDTGPPHVARPGETFLLCFQVRLFLMLVCVAVVAMLYILLCSHACLRPCCRAPGPWGSPVAPTTLSFQGYSRVPDGKVRGMEQCRGWCSSLTCPCLSFPFLREGWMGLWCVRPLRS